MKKLLILCCAICITAHSFGQDSTSVLTEKKTIILEYDDAGNRIVRKMVRTASADSTKVTSAIPPRDTLYTCGITVRYPACPPDRHGILMKKEEEA